MNKLSSEQRLAELERLVTRLSSELKLVRTEATESRRELRVIRPMMLEQAAHIEDLERQIQALKRPSERPTRPPPMEPNVLGVRGALPPRK